MTNSSSRRLKNVTGSIFAHRYQTRSCVARSSHAGSSKATTQDLAFARISKCKSKSEALSLSRPSIPATAGENDTSCTVPDVVDNKNKVTSPVTSKLIREKSLQSCLEKDIVGHIRAEEDICVGHRIKPLGASCQLCSLDLAFTPMNFSESLQFNEFPTAAVLSCGHCYHNLCVEAVFGTVEPPCITCLGC
ncbi:hypothetical protein KFK09_015670 [Dendrobium nobile]|uniref:RING-type domain-containing protein n=1 Tax=Dendrobium nobile TaxID=94219 RepID=A0A8T3B565_DENNO|nr:hypothetical protein KFK09_015670 [Dendrobium nobile]